MKSLLRKATTGMLKGEGATTQLFRCPDPQIRIVPYEQADSRTAKETPSKCAKGIQRGSAGEHRWSRELPARLNSGHSKRLLTRARRISRPSCAASTRATCAGTRGACAPAATYCSAPPPAPECACELSRRSSSLSCESVHLGPRGL